MRFFDLDHKIHQNQNHEITKISKIKIMRSQDFFDLELVDQKIMDHKYDPQFYDLIFDLPTVKINTFLYEIFYEKKFPELVRFEIVYFC